MDVLVRQECNQGHTGSNSSTQLPNTCTFYVETMMAQLNPGARGYDRQVGALRNVNNHRGKRSPTDAMEIRNCYKTYFFNAVGAVPFQMERISYM